MVKVMMVKIENNKECFVQLWLLLERTRRMLGAQYKRFCIWLHFAVRPSHNRRKVSLILT